MKSRASLAEYAEAYVESLPTHVHAVNELIHVRDVLEAVPKLRIFVSDGSIDAEKRAMAMTIATEGCRVETANFVLLLAEHELLKRLDRVTELVRKASAKKTGKTYARVTSVVELQRNEASKLQTLLKSKLKTDVELEEGIDRSLIGGLFIEAGDWVFDASVRGKLKRLHRAMTA